MTLMIFIVSVMLLGGFTSNCKQEVPPQCKQFFDLPRTQRKEEFKKYSIEKQFDLYMCAMRQHPPQMGYAWDISEHGEKALPFLSEKLKSEKDEINQLHIITVLDVMSQSGTLRGKGEIIHLIDQTVSAMKIYTVKDQCERMLKSIKHNSVDQQG